MAIKMQSLSSLLSSFSSAFYSDDFFALTSLHSAILSHPDFSSSSPPSSEFEKFCEESQSYSNCLTHLFSPEWDTVSELNDIKVETHYSGANFYTRSSVSVQSSILEGLSVIGEMDLLPSW
jgi:hypothetical protein